MKILFITIFLCQILWCYAQVNPAIMAHKNGDLRRAKDIIDSLAELPKFEKDAEVMYVKGLIYESLFLTKDSLYKYLSEFPLLDAFDAYKIAKSDIGNKKFSSAAVRQMDSSLSVNLLCEGLRLLEEKKIPASIDLLEAYVQIKPKDTLRYLDIAIAADKIKNRDIAKRNFNKLLTSSYKSPFVYKSLYFIYRDERNYEEADKLVKKAKKMYPDDKDLIKMEINLLVDVRKYAQALGKLDTAITIDPEYKANYLYNIAAIYQLQDSTELAKEVYVKALEVDPDYFEANFNLGGIYYEKARKFYVEINTMDYGAYQKSGRKLEEKGHSYARQALPYFEKCYNLDKNNEAVKGFLMDLYRNLKMKEKAREMEDALVNVK